MRRALLVVATIVSMLVAGPAVARATVGTDQPDYGPGSVVTVSGDNSNGVGYVPGNTVEVFVTGPNSWASTCEATVLEDGTWSCQVTLDSDPDVAVGEYTYTAASTAADGSPISESGTFADAISTRIANAAVTPTSQAPGGSLTFSGTLQQYVLGWKALGGYNVRLYTYPGCIPNTQPPAEGLLASATTTSSGAFSIPWTAPSAEGSYSYALRFAGAGGGTYAATTACLTVTVNRLLPAFTFVLPTGFSKVYGNADFSVADYASKPADDTGAITFETAADSVGCTVTPTGTVHITGAAEGSKYCKLTASLAADDKYIAPDPITQQFHIAMPWIETRVHGPAVAPTSVALGGSLTFTGTLQQNPFDLGWTGMGSSTVKVQRYTSPDCAELAEVVAYSDLTPASGAFLIPTTAPSTPGTYYYALRYAGAGDGMWSATTSACLTVTVTKLTPTFTFNLPTGLLKTYGDADFSVAGYASKPSDDSGAITFVTAADSVGCTVTAVGTVHITGAAVDSYCKITASLAEDATYLAAGPITQQFHVAKLGTSALYTGAQSAVIGSSFIVSGSLAPSACAAGQPLTFAVESPVRAGLTTITIPGIGTPAYVVGTGTIGSDGKATISVSTTGWTEYVGSLYAIFLGSGNCLASYDEASLMVGSAGGSAQGGGWEASGVSNGRLNFGLTINLVPGTGGTTGVPAKYKGQFVMVNNGAWRLKGTLNTYVQTTTTQGVTGSSDGLGTLYKWVLLDPATNLYGWQKAADNVKFSIAFADNNNGGGKKTTYPDKFGIQVQYSASAIPNNKAQPSDLKGGDISIKTPK